jgi:hypothetical protein
VLSSSCPSFTYLADYFSINTVQFTGSGLSRYPWCTP